MKFSADMDVYICVPFGYFSLSIMDFCGLVLHKVYFIPFAGELKLLHATYEPHPGVVWGRAESPTMAESTGNEATVTDGLANGVAWPTFFSLGEIRVARESDFEHFRRLADDSEGWTKKLDRDGLTVWNRDSGSTSIKMFKVCTCLICLRSRPV